MSLQDYIMNIDSNEVKHYLVLILLFIVLFFILRKFINRILTKRRESYLEYEKNKNNRPHK